MKRKPGDAPPAWKVRSNADVARGAAEKRQREAEAAAWIAEVRARRRPKP
jgi:hypothetical protein